MNDTSVFEYFEKRYRNVMYYYYLIIIQMCVLLQF